MLSLLLAAGLALAEPSVRPGANQQYFDQDLSVWQRRFERAGREIFDHKEKIVAMAGLRPGMVVADVGAGTGLFTFAFAEAVAPGGRVYAVDIIPKFVDHVAGLARARQVKNVVPVLGKPKSAPLPENSVDLVFLCDTYHHFEYPRSMNRSLLRALKPGGTLLLIDFQRVPGKTPPDILEHVRAGKEVFTRELREAGFEVVEEVPMLTENYVVRLRKPKPAQP